MRGDVWYRLCSEEDKNILDRKVGSFKKACFLYSTGVNMMHVCPKEKEKIYLPRKLGRLQLFLKAFHQQSAMP